MLIQMKLLLNNTSNNNNNWNNNTSNNNNTSSSSSSAKFTVEAENYAYASGVEKAGGVVGYIDPGDWMSYNVNVPSSGTYSVALYFVATSNALR